MGRKHSAIDRLFDLTLKPNNTQPPPDIAICSQCGWRGDTGDCETDTEGDWESGYHTVYLCPKCEDGGCIDDYDMTAAREKEWNEWNEWHAKKLD